MHGMHWQWTRTPLSDADRIWYGGVGLVDLAPVGFHQLLQFTLAFLLGDTRIGHNDWGSVVSI